jgi:hypothetical protein
MYKVLDRNVILLKAGRLNIEVAQDTYMMANRATGLIIEDG